ncbi:Holliday junction branch migration protein RuvA [Myxococcota bacterium]|nr:Holliday junction branch migration protein RuvA [Myxococcota bacterium]
MIARLTGDVVERLPGAVVLDVRGVGYLVLVGPRLAGELTEGATTLYISTQVSEDSFRLFGFGRAAERQCFELLTTMPRVGPKLSQALVDHLGLEGLAAAIDAEDTRALAAAPGVGKKTAERLVLELRGKIPVEFRAAAAAATAAAAEAPPKTKDHDTLVLALAQLGYRKSEIDQALAGLAARGLDGADVPTRLSHSLKILSGG